METNVVKEIEVSLPHVDLSKGAVSTNQARHLPKDQYKCNESNKFIGRGSLGSSTSRYTQLLREAKIPVNSGQYTSDDVVFISVNGNRRDGLPVDHVEVEKAINAQATIMTDGYKRRPEGGHSYNTGEQLLANLLRKHGYGEIQELNGLVARWHKKGTTPVKLIRKDIAIGINLEHEAESTKTAQVAVLKSDWCVIRKVDPFLSEKMKNSFQSYEAMSVAQLNAYNKKVVRAAQKQAVLVGTELECKCYAFGDEQTRSAVIDRIQIRKELFHPLKSSPLSDQDIEKLRGVYNSLTEQIKSYAQIDYSKLSTQKIEKQLNKA